MLEMNYTSPNSHVFKLRAYAHQNGNIIDKLCQAKDYFSDKKKKKTNQRASPHLTVFIRFKHS